jgi:inhibitor of cysteine peptidase
VADIVATHADNGSVVNARVGDTIELTLPETPSTGYRWEVEAFDAAHIDVAPAGMQHEADAGVGGGGIRSWRLRVLRSGATNVTFVQRRPWERADAAVDRFAIAVQTIDAEP